MTYIEGFVRESERRRDLAVARLMPPPSGLCGGNMTRTGAKANDYAAL